MIHEYPDYYEKFKCIGGSCEDSCCLGWEVDIDEESYYYYLTVQGEFGERLRSTMKEEDGERFFPLRENGRCPFLNDKNLCDIYTALGEDRLCTVCTEYPRYYEVVGNYEQIDMSLSCMEYGRLYFGDSKPVHYIKNDDGFGGDGLSARNQKRLDKAILLRDETIKYINVYDIDGRSLTEFFSDVSDFMKNKAHSMRLNTYKSIDEYTWVYDNGVLKKSAVSELNQLMSSLEILDDRWNAVLSDTGKTIEDWDGREKLFLESFSHESYFLFKKLMTYFVFRYTIETYFDGNANYEIGLIEKSVMYIYVMFINKYAQLLAEGAVPTTDDDRRMMVDLAHLYSREVEHSDDNLLILKGNQA